MQARSDLTTKCKIRLNTSWNGSGVFQCWSGVLQSLQLIALQVFLPSHLCAPGTISKRSGAEEAQHPPEQPCSQECPAVWDRPLQHTESWPSTAAQKWSFPSEITHQAQACCWTSTSLYHRTVQKPHKTSPQEAILKNDEPLRCEKRC